MNSVRTMHIVRGLAVVLICFYAAVALGTYFVIPVHEAMTKSTTPLGHINLLASAAAVKAVGAVFLRICRLQLALFSFFVAGAIFSFTMLIEGGRIFGSLIFFFEFLVLGFFMFIWSRQAKRAQG